MKTKLLLAFNKFKKYFFLLICVTGFTANAQSWGTQTSGITDKINSIYFIDKDTGYVAAAGGRILKTIDGGLSWSVQNSGVVTELMSIFFITYDTGYAAGQNGRILRTINAGNTWDTLASGTTEHLNSIYYTNSSIGYAVGNTGTIIKTIDGGGTWNAQTSGINQQLNEVFFIDSISGFAVGTGTLNATILVTFNGGSNWSAQTSGTLNTLNSVYFIDSDTGYAVGQLGTMLKTTNAGTTWSTIVSGTVSNLNSVYFITDRIGFAAGATGTILKTTNYGANWSALTSGVTNNLNSIYMIDSYIGYSAGDAGTILKTCPTVAFSTFPNDTVCLNTTITFTNQSYNASSYIWKLNSDTLATSVDFIHMFDTTGTFAITLIADNGACSQSYSWNVVINPNPIVHLGNDTTICSTCTVTLNAGNIGSTYVWYRDSAATGSTSQTITVGLQGAYSVWVTNSHGCQGSDTLVLTLLTSMNEVSEENNVVVYPNPNNGRFNLSFHVDNKQGGSIRIFNYLGEAIYSEELNNTSGYYNRQFDISNFSKGIYIIEIQQNNTTTLRKIISF